MRRVLLLLAACRSELPETVEGFDPSQRARPVFEAPAVALEVRLIANFVNLEEGGTLVLRDGGRTVRAPVALGVRGNARSLCPFKPLRVRFRGEAPPPFAGMEKLRWVTHCGRKEDPDEVLGELGQYRTVEALGGPAFRVQLVRAAYDDLGSGRRTIAYAFLLERDEDLLARIGAARAIGPIPFAARAETHLIERMLGNTDYNLSVSTNLVPIRAGDRVMIVPYDFDLSAESWGRPRPEPHDDWYQNGPLRTEMKDRVGADREEAEATVRAIARRHLERRASVMRVIAESALADRAAIASDLDGWFDFLVRVADPPPL